MEAGTTVREHESTTRRGSTLQIHDLAPGRVSMERDPAFMAERASMGESTDLWVHQPTKGRAAAAVPQDGTVGTPQSAPPRRPRAPGAGRRRVTGVVLSHVDPEKRNHHGRGPILQYYGVFSRQRHCALT